MAGGRRRCGALVSVAAAMLLSVNAQAAPNILLIIGDDMGVETLASYGLGENPPTTASLDEMAREGVIFRNFWAQPVCSPTRATIISGRYGFRTGIGRPVGASAMPPPPEIPDGVPAESRGAPNAASPEDFALPRPYLLPDEFTLPMALKADENLGYSTAAIGKWHLAGDGNGWTDHPNLAGFDHFSGLMGGGPESYFAWRKTINGEVSGEIGYTASDKVDDAIDWLDEQGSNPWLLWFAFNLAHTPLHLPPEEQLQSDYSHIDPKTMPEESWQAAFSGMMEAMDTQIGRLLASLDPETRANTYVIFIGDNGTYDPVVAPPFRHGRAKGTIYEGGVNVPLIVTGPGVESGRESDALVNSTDLFATIIEMAGIDPVAVVPEDVTHDSISFLPTLLETDESSQREWLYADEFFGGFDGVAGADYAMRNTRYKLLRFDGEEELYDLRVDPYEHENLLSRELSPQERAEYETLKAQIAELRSSE